MNMIHSITDFHRRPQRHANNCHQKIESCMLHAEAYNIHVICPLHLRCKEVFLSSKYKHFATILTKDAA